MAGRLTGRRLSFGPTVRVGDRAVIPVSRVRMAGRFGFGAPGDSGEDGGGGGGIVLSRPVGFIDVGPEGARFRSLGPSRSRLLAAGAGGALATAAAAGVLVGAGVAGRAAYASLRPRLVRRRPRGPALLRRRSRRR
jgi:hypothetical protein